jgi:hypothetical protein
MSEPFDSIASIRKDWPSLSWPVRALYASVPVLIALVTTGVFYAGWKAFFPSTEEAGGSATSAPRMPSERMRHELVTSLRRFPPESFTISRTLSDAESVERANAVRGDLLEANWKDDSGVIVIGEHAATSGVTVRMKKSPPGSVYLLNWLNRAGLQARGLADVPQERTYDVAIEFGPAPRDDAGE